MTLQAKNRLDEMVKHMLHAVFVGETYEKAKSEVSIILSSSFVLHSLERDYLGI
jgi:hypothetical protein